MGAIQPSRLHSPVPSFVMPASAMRAGARILSAIIDDVPRVGGGIGLIEGGRSAGRRTVGSDLVLAVIA
jgi:hypothetical protein